MAFQIGKWGYNPIRAYNLLYNWYRAQFAVITIFKYYKDPYWPTTVCPIGSMHGIYLPASSRLGIYIYHTWILWAQWSIIADHLDTATEVVKHQPGGVQSHAKALGDGSPNNPRIQLYNHPTI